MTDLVALARKHKHVAATHYEGCESDHIGCLVNKLADEIERLREALQESACACSSIRECASTWARQDECAHLTARKALEGKP